MINRHSGAASIDPDEVEQFARLGAQWWNPRGPMAALHKFNPVRLGYIRDEAVARFSRDPKKLDCLSGLRVLDIGDRRSAEFHDKTGHDGEFGSQMRCLAPEKARIDSRRVA